MTDGKKHINSIVQTISFSHSWFRYYLTGRSQRIVGSDITLLGEARESGLAQNCQAQNNWWRECLKGEHSVLIWTNQIQVVYMSHIQDFIYLPEIVRTLLGQSVHLEHMLLHIFTNGNIHMPNKIMGRGA